MLPPYSYSKKIEEVLEDVNYIRYLKSLPMDCFESEIWNKFGKNSVPASDRRKVISHLNFLLRYSLFSIMLVDGCNCTHTYPFFFSISYSSAMIFITCKWIDICSHAGHVFNKNCCMHVCCIVIQYF